MPNKQRRKPCAVALAAAPALFVLVLAGCASHGAPKHGLATAAESAREAYGGWIIVQTGAAVGPSGGAALVGLVTAGELLAGELLAVEADTLYVLLAGTVEALPRAGIAGARLARYDARWQVLGLWGAAGTLSTLSHGYLLMISATVWSMGSLGMAVAASRQPLMRHPETPLAGFAPYARFPQGLPAGLRHAGARLTPRAARVPR